MNARLLRRILVLLPIVVALSLLGTLYPQPGELARQAMAWLTDTAGPEIGVDLPQGYVHGFMPLSVALTDESWAEVRSLAVDGEPISVGAREIDTSRLSDGEHTLAIGAADKSLRKNAAQASFSFRTDNTPPKVAAQTDPPQVGQGRTLAIKINSSEPVTLTGSLGGQSLSFLRLEDRYWSVLGFAPESKVGSRSLDVLAVDKAGLETKIRVPITVTRVDYPTESLYIPEDRSGLLSPSVGEEENNYLAKVFGAATPDKLWSGSFTMPARGQTSSPFAIRRSYNGGPFGSHHGGMDIAIAEGVPVAAANRGRVAVAEPLKVRGNVVILDHGMGVYSAYFHLSQIKAQKDEIVEKGQIIGLVGNTGLSTGAHLHWEMRVGGAAVDPLEWTTRVIP